MFEDPQSPAPDPAAAAPDATLAELVDRRMDALFADPSAPAGASTGTVLGVTAIELPGSFGSSSEDATAVADQGDPIRAFCEITRTYIAPVRRFVSHLRNGPTSSAGLDMHRPAMEMVVRAAERLPVGDLVSKLSRFAAALQTAVEAREPIVSGIVRTRILDSYDALEQALPAAFRLEEAAPPSAEDIILLALLRQIPDVGTVTLDKIFGAGLTAVEMFAEATPKDLAVTAGISESLATRICVRVQGYLAARSAADDPAARAERIGRVAALVAELRDAHQAYEALRREDRVRWAHRRRRLDLVLQIQVALAELGERGLVDTLRPLPYEKRIDRLTRYVESVGGRVPRMGSR
ncbi:MAG: hypothetical protein U0610_20815 [bacterium]